MKQKFFNKLIFRCLLLSAGMGCFAVPVHAQDAQTNDSNGTVPQKDVIDILKTVFKTKEKKTDSFRLNKKFQFSIIPIAGNVAGGGTAVATAFNAAFFTGNEQTTSLSTITFTPWFTLKGKFVLPFRNMVWLPNDLLLWKGDTRFMVYPQYTWGIGGNTDPDSKVLLQYNYVRFYHSLLKKTGKIYYIGAGYNLDYHFNAIIDSDSNEIKEIPLFDYDKELRENTVSSGLVANFLIDSRHNSVNPAGGTYVAVDYRFNPEFMGSTFEWQSILVDVRKYFPFQKSRQNLLAVWSYYWAVTHGKAPYLDLPSIGWDYYSRSGRGFQQNRYRGKKLVYLETEYRRDITRNGFWGFVAFANLHSVSEYQAKSFMYWHPAAGAGLRIKFNKISKTNIGLDIAFSKDYTGIYVLLGESF